MSVLESVKGYRACWKVLESVKGVQAWRVVYLHVARLNLSRLRGLPRGWENSYLGGSCGERSGKQSVSSWYQSTRLITARWKMTSWHDVASQQVGSAGS